MTLIDTGLFRFRLEEAPRQVGPLLQQIYDVAPGSDDDLPADFRISLRYDAPLRRFLRPQITFYSDLQPPFKPVPLSQAFPILEWGMNWCIATQDYNRFILHAAVLARGDKALVFPAAPGSGKSTLTAYLALSGWTLFSDEMAIIDLNTCRVHPVFRPVCLKNDSIDLMGQWFPDAVLTPATDNTQKGRVAHLKAMNRESYQDLEPATIVGIVFPRYDPNSELLVFTLDNIQAFSQVCTNAFNYNILGRDAFDTVATLVDNTRQLEIHYNSLTEVDDFLRGEFLL